MKAKKKVGTFSAVHEIKGHGWEILIDYERDSRTAANRVFACPSYKTIKGSILNKELRDRHDPILPPEVIEVMDFYILCVGINSIPRALRTVVVYGD
jgi:hypothetical protein